MLLIFQFNCVSPTSFLNLDFLLYTLFQNMLFFQTFLRNTHAFDYSEEKNSAFPESLLIPGKKRFSKPFLHQSLSTMSSRNEDLVKLQCHSQACRLKRQQSKSWILLRDGKLHSSGLPALLSRKKIQVFVMIDHGTDVFNYAFSTTVYRS